MFYLISEKALLSIRKAGFRACHLPKDLTIVSCPLGRVITQKVARRGVIESLQIVPISENIQWSERQWISTHISLHWTVPCKKNLASK